MELANNLKVTNSHLQRDAFLYIRQSSLRQIFENTESTKRQYDLRQRAVALGWPEERIHVIDNDLGQSAASIADREGFKRLVTEVSLSHAGIVMGLEVSRLARNSADWHRLLEICALTQTLILDEDGLYNPNDFNDRLLLGLKGTMSEAELHFMRARLQGGLLNKARRGELTIRLPVGFLYDEQGRVILDPDKQVRETIKLFFATFQRSGSTRAVVSYFSRHGLRFPQRLREKIRKGELVWTQLSHTRALHVLHNPRYAGAFFFGRTRAIKRLDGTILSKAVPRDQWHVLIPDMHEGYITWEEYEQNQQRLLESARAYGLDRRNGPAREGPALLQGLVICGHCGRRMTVMYHLRKGLSYPDYRCQREHVEYATPSCQYVTGQVVDKAIGELLLETLTPMSIEASLAVEQELQARVQETDRIRRQHVERVRLEADIARRRFMKVNIENRLVADELESDWNQKLREYKKAQDEYECQRQKDRLFIDEETRCRVMALASDFPKLWKDPKIPNQDRKRMVRLLIEDVTLTKDKIININVRFRGGMTKVLTRPIPLQSWEKWKTPPQVIKKIDRLLDNHTNGEIAAILNEQDLRSGKNLTFRSRTIGNIQKAYSLKSRYDRLREAGKLTLKEMQAALDICSSTVRAWHKAGLLRGYRYNEKEYLYDPPTGDFQQKRRGKKLSERLAHMRVLQTSPKEVQYEV